MASRVAPTRSAMALLLTLAAVVLLLIAVGGSLGALQTGRQAVAMRHVDGHLAQGLAAGEQVAIQWLRQNSRELVLPLEGGGITILNDRLEVVNGHARIQVRLYDELGMLPAHLLHATGPLRGAFPPGWSSVNIPRIQREQWEQPSDLIETMRLPAGRRRFPTWSQEPLWTWRDASTASRPSMTADSVSLVRGITLAETVGFRSIPRLNVNTAPEPVLRSVGAFLHLNRSVVDSWCQQRRKGKFIGAPEGLSRDTEHPLLLVESSDAWNALVTVEWNGVRRAWWAVIAGNARSFWIVQRHDASR